MRPRGLVLLTRPLAESHATAAALAAAGWQSFVESLLTIEHLAPGLPDYDALVFTSAHGVAAFAALARRRDVPVFAVGNHTATRARQAGYVDITAGPGTARALAALLQGETRKVLHPCGRDLTPDALAIPAGRIVVYQAVAAQSLTPDCRRLFAEGAFAAALFFSARTGRIFSQLVAGLPEGDSLRQTKALCLSETVLESVRALPWAATLVAPAPDRTAMIATLGQWQDGSNG